MKLIKQCFLLEECHSLLALQYSKQHLNSVIWKTKTNKQKTKTKTLCALWFVGWAWPQLCDAVRVCTAWKEGRQVFLSVFMPMHERPALMSPVLLKALMAELRWIFLSLHLGNDWLLFSLDSGPCRPMLFGFLVFSCPWSLDFLHLLSAAFWAMPSVWLAVFSGGM